MARWLPGVLTRIRSLAALRRVLFTLKARRELSELELGLDEQDACDCLAALSAEDSAGRRWSHLSREWMYIFTPSVAGVVLYLKVIVRSDCIVVSFHENRLDS